MRDPRRLCDRDGLPKIVRMTSTVPLPAHLEDAVRSETSLRRFLEGLPGVDPVGVEQRAAGLATRSIKKASKLAAIDLAISMVDLTTLEGADTEGKVRNLCRKAMLPDPEFPDVPRTAAVCVYPDLAATAVEMVRGSGVKVAAVATAFPSGRSSVEVKLADVRLAVQAGADEIDMVIDRGAYLAGRYGVVFDQIQQVKAACGDARLKVILETGELATYDNVRRASWLALLAGGIKTTKDAIRYLVAVHEVAGPEWLDPYWFRFGASSLLNDLLMQRRTQLEGHYSGPDYVTVD